MTGSLERLIAVTREYLRSRGAEPGTAVEADMAICQDLLIFGIDVDDYVDALAADFGPVVREVPWRRYTDQTASFRGCGVVLFPLWLVGRALLLPLRGGPLIPTPDPRGHPWRLTLRDLAAGIEAGHWIEPAEKRR